MSVSVEGVTKYYGEQKALNNVSFGVNTGEIVGFLGPNGAGKSTMMKIITGFIPPSSGRVMVNGLDVETGLREIRSEIGYLPENNPLYPDMYVREYLEFAASLYKSDVPVRKQVERIVEVTGLAPEQRKKIGSLSKGFRQRVGLAQALIHNPGVLILDEPTTGLDPNQIVEIRNLIQEAGKKKTVLLSTHIMQEVEAICDRVIIIDKGVIVANEDISKIYSVVSRTGQVIEVEFDREIGEELMHKMDPLGTIRKTGSKTLIIEASGDEDIRPLVFSFAVNNNLTVLSLQKKESNLEEIFRLLTNG
jgi:ABC-2 type transport system ATP-binding protein